MCDILTKKCAVKGCRNGIELHIADFCVKRDSFDVYCMKHIPRNKDRVEVVVTEHDSKKDSYSSLGWCEFGYKFAIIHHNPQRFPIACMHDKPKDRCLHKIEDTITYNGSCENMFVKVHRKSKKKNDC